MKLPQTFSGHANGNGVAISTDGVNWYTVYTSTAAESVWATTEIDLAAAAAAAGITLGPNFKVKFQEYGHGLGLALDNIAVVAPDPDFYRFSLNAGEHITIAAAAETSDSMQLQLLDATAPPWRLLKRDLLQPRRLAISSRQVRVFTM